MQIVIDIPNSIYANLPKIVNGSIASKRILDCVKNGTPLDDIKADIAEEICLTDNPYTKETAYTIEHLRLLEILDNIGKARPIGSESEVEHK